MIHGLNHRRSGNLLEAKIVPARTEVCLRQALHWNSSRAPRVMMQCAFRRNQDTQNHRASAI